MALQSLRTFYQRLALPKLYDLEVSGITKAGSCVPVKYAITPQPSLSSTQSRSYSQNTTSPPPPSKMTVRANKFTPEVLLSAPRRSPATPNPTGTLALFTVSTYSFQSHSKTSEIRVLDIKTGHSKLLSSDGSASEPTWLLENDLVLWLKGDKGKTNLVIADAGNFENT